MTASTFDSRSTSTLLEDGADTTNVSTFTYSDVITASNLNKYSTFSDTTTSLEVLPLCAFFFLLAFLLLLPHFGQRDCHKQ